jgi:N-glycosylase/DNA lyase
MRDYISGFTLKEILEIEHSDLQLLALKKMWKKIKDKDSADLFLFLILQNALVSYQIAG